MFYTLVKNLGLIFIAVVMFRQLTIHFSPMIAFTLWGFVITVCVLIGTWALSTSTTEKITWKNRLAAYLMPWGWRLNFGKLWPIALISWFIWMLLVIATYFALENDFVSQPLGAKRVSWNAVFLLISWIVDAAAILYLLGTLLANFSLDSTGGKSLMRLIAVLISMLVISACLIVMDAPRWALLVSGGPIALVGGAYGLFLAILLILGRNTRWN